MLSRVVVRIGPLPPLIDGGQQLLVLGLHCRGSGHAEAGGHRGSDWERQWTAAVIPKRDEREDTAVADRSTSQPSQRYTVERCSDVL